ncbi:uncharacterized protein LOC125542967 [Triticum urartu]|uniref:Uncharacterized protein n=2 Tax=Triticum urartu TaxID=4572 RepID=A0A8R7P579_TRIUA|nr:uncharacterized protein LOC125542967 [Triticum urartu]
MQSSSPQSPHPHETLAAESRSPSRLRRDGSTPTPMIVDQMPMPQKRRRRRRRPLEGVSRRRLGDGGASLSGSLVDPDSDSSSRVDGGSPPPGLPDDEPAMSGSVVDSDGGSPPPDEPATEPRYHEIVASRLAQLELPVGSEWELAGLSNIPSREILEALTRKSFHDDESRAALVQYQIQCFLNEETQEGRDRDSQDSAVVVVAEPANDAITKQQHKSDCEKLGARMTEIETYTELDQEETNKFHLKYALYRIKACLLLKGVPVDKIDDAALERKYPPELIVKNDYFFHYVQDGFFGWYFDSELCYKKSLSDYQRLVIFNDGGLEYTRWSRYRAFYSTPDADRDYLQYWETIVKEIKWLEQYLLTNESSIEWARIHSKATFQACRIAAGFQNMTLELAAAGLHEYIWNARMDLMFEKDRDGVFYQIWKRVNDNHQLSFRDALEQVYGENLYSAHDRSMKYELNYGDSNMERVFARCTKGISDSVPEYKARELIAQEIRWTSLCSGTYEQYARKKLKIAELIGLIPKDKIGAA